eukprot:gene806-biopygen827
MMSAVKMVISSLSANSCASFVTATSKQRITAYFGCFSFIPTTRMIVFLCRSPTPTVETGILLSCKNTSSASRAPRVDAWTATPKSPWVRLMTVPSSRMTSSCSSSMSSPSFTTSMGVPGTASSRPVAAILIPWAALMALWWMYSPFTRISFIGCGVSNARTCVTIGPFNPQMRIVSPSRSVPLTRMTSMVTP